MPRRPATVTQADIARTVRAAKQAGASEVEVRVGSAVFLIRLESSTGPDLPPVPEKEIVL